MSSREPLFSAGDRVVIQRPQNVHPFAYGRLGTVLGVGAPTTAPFPLHDPRTTLRRRAAFHLVTVEMDPARADAYLAGSGISFAFWPYELRQLGVVERLGELA